MKKLRVLIAEDHTILREGLRLLLATDPDIELAGEANNGLDAVRLSDILNPDLVIMDLSMPGITGIEAITEIKRRSSRIKLLALTMHKTEEYVRETLKAGADGYVLKDACSTDLFSAIRGVFMGKTFLSPGISRTATGHTVGGGTAEGKTAWDALTRREKEVLKLIAEGHTNKQVAKRLRLSVKTVEKHRSNLMRKLDVHNASGLTSLAIGKGLVSIRQHSA